MRKILLSLIILMGLSCEPKISTSKKNTTNSTSTIETKEEAKKKINLEYTTALAKCSQNVVAVSTYNAKTEFWKICSDDKNLRILQIESYEKDILYKEVYFEQNGELVYAEEWMEQMPANHYILNRWMCKFYMKTGKLSSIASMGHGKTENEDWNPEIILEMYTNRLAELDKLAKE